MLNVCSQIENITSGIANGWYLPVEPSGESVEAENEKESRLFHCAYPVCARHEHRYYTAGLTVLSGELDLQPGGFLNAVDHVNDSFMIALKLNTLIL